MLKSSFSASIGFILIATFVARSGWAGEPSSAPQADGAGSFDQTFVETVRPFLATYCVRCHGNEGAEADLDLSAYASTNDVATDLTRWDRVLKRLRRGTMPPEKAKRKPDAQTRSAIVGWIEALRAREVARNEGDPGIVPDRRLSNSEYDNIIKDVTGVDVAPAREFPVDPANEAGFDNSAQSLTISPELVKKYLAAARSVADHLILKPRGFSFAPFAAVADTDRDKYCVRRVIEFYQRQKLDYADFFFAAWTYKHRNLSGAPGKTLAEIADDEGISSKYLDRIWSVLNESAGSIGPIAALQSLWRELPATANGSTAEARRGCERMRDFVVELRRLATPEIKNLTSPSVHPGSQPLVLWKNREYSKNRTRYAGITPGLKREKLTTGTETARKLALPADPSEIAPYEPSFERFCSTFPDAFYVSERARVYLDAKSEKNNTGRLLSAGFHSMTGFFRDDAPLSDLILNEKERRELDELWREFHFITLDPMRQYASFLWFDRTDSRFMRGAEFDFARAEDRDSASSAKIKRLADVYLNKAIAKGAGPIAQDAIRTYFTTIDEQIRAVERDRLAAEPSHVEALVSFAEKAFRRALTAEDRASVESFYRSARSNDSLSHEDAVRDTIVYILMSPKFLYHRFETADAGSADALKATAPGSPRSNSNEASSIRPTADAGSLDRPNHSIRPLDDESLANRLSYFLWASPPDRELRDRAVAGDLRRREVLIAQTRRMLADEKVRRFATEFLGNQLDFRRFEEHNAVDRGRFPNFNEELRKSMFEEPIRFFVDLIRNNGRLDEMINSDYTFVDSSLAKHYGMSVSKFDTDGWARVEGVRRLGRGGLLPMAVFLTKNAPGLRTSPVKRGYWVVRRLLGEEIPPPPPTVPELPSDEAKLGDQTLRKALERHRADKSCSGCHDRFDSIGLAFEGFGPVGERRDKDLGGRPIDARATFPDGGEGTGVEGLRHYILKFRHDEFVDNFCRKLLAYALGRTTIPTDDAVVRAMRDRLEADGGRIDGLFETIVMSKQFLNRRVDVD
jgi:cytochrome c553